ncbi:MAG: sigma-70 family RNA polymerase sigma factor [Planctomycetaceae bacterium]|nr:sigma-70 family RNA polymerase sigma factor [Planctomycetaceae bacterium]
MDSQHRLSNIETNWTELGFVHQNNDRSSCVEELRRAFLLRYAGSVYNYLLKCVRDAHAADDLAQEFAIRFLRGQYINAAPDRGRFRDYLKKSLTNLANDFFRRKSSEQKMLGKVARDQQTTADQPEADFDEIWRQELLGQTWNSLRDYSSASNNAYYEILRLRAELPDESMAVLSTKLTVQIDGKVPTEDWVRQTLLRARKKYGELLRCEVARTLSNADSRQIDEELAALGLLIYCSN